MECVANKKDLIEAVEAARRVVPSAASLPALTAILLSAQDGGSTPLCLRATDMQTTVEADVPVLATRSGQCAVPAQTLAKLLKKVPGSTVTLRVSNNGQVTFASSSMKVDVASEDPAQFPSVPKPPPGWDTDNMGDPPTVKLSVDAKQLLATLDKVMFACYPSSDRRNLTGVLFEVIGVPVDDETESYHLQLVASDGARLALASLDCNVSAGTSCTFLVPGDTLKLMAKIYNVPGDVEINAHDGMIEFNHVRHEDSQVNTLQTGSTPPRNLRVFTSLLDLKFPDYRSLSDHSAAIVLTMPNKQLIDALEQVCVLMPNLNHLPTSPGELATQCVEFILVKDADVSLKSQVRDKGTAVATIETPNVEYYTDKMRVGLNGKLLLKGLAVFAPSTHITLTFSDPVEPIVLTTDADPSIRQLYMPTTTPAES